MIFQPKLLYRVAYNSWLYKSDKDNALSPSGRSIMTEVPAKSIIMFVKKGRFRFIKVTFKDLVGYLWMPLNVPTHLFMSVVNMDEEEAPPGPFVRPGRAAFQHA